ncbi:hypothetical protein AVEN_263517-1 [Araneus ventricosus]|uniref:THAP-type domain-containing protein n=1 Tax=Araneus ventricosus TaxID=182803 RepID=A0A4Y2EUX9_ARAVE|nr:hypothetical protein AVEN_263517-1 [Araneus ventricosus]
MFILPALLYLKVLPLFGQRLYHFIVRNKSRPPHDGGAALSQLVLTRPCTLLGLAGPMRMPNACCVTNCRGNYDAENKVAVFSFPKVEELKLKWIQAIPRRDLVVTKNTKVCEKHFTDDDIERVSTFYKESTGETLIAKLKKPRLKKGATPKIFPHCPSYLSSTKVARDGPEDVHIVPVSHIVAEDLFTLIKKIILALEEIGFKGMGIVTDNNSINRKAVSNFNNPPQFQAQYQHPADEKRPLFCLIDSVHLIKCVRNNWINQKNGYFMYYPQFEGEENAVQTASFSILRKLYDIESSELLKFGIGLTRKALWPTNLERQNVSLALKIFSSNLVKGLLELGEKHNLMHYGGTANFLNIFCTWWDIANVKTVTWGNHLD